MLIIRALRTGSEQYRVVTREHLRPAMCILALFQFCHRLGLASLIGNAGQSRTSAEGHDDESFVAPTGPSARNKVQPISSHTFGRVESDRRAPASRNLLDLSHDEKADPFAVRREKRVDGVLRSGQLG